jgi:hypothetical protein
VPFSTKKARLLAGLFILGIAPRHW